MRRFLFTLLQLTWGLPQTILGFIPSSVGMLGAHVWYHHD